jgi:hypothetical protein
MVGQVTDSMMMGAKREREASEETGRTRQNRGEGPARDVTSAKSTTSMSPDAAAVMLEAAAGVTAPGEVEPFSQPPPQEARNSSNYEPAWDAWARSGKGKGKGGHVSQSRQRHSNWPNKSTKPVVVQAETLDLLLTLALQSSRRLNDLEATSYYTHTIPTASDMCLHIEEKYQGYLVATQKNKDHNMGPPSIHRGIALLKQIMDHKESLLEKSGLSAMWPVVQAALDELSLEETELSESQSIVGHCKIAQMYDKTRTRLTFSFPLIVTCGHKTHTLGSVVSRLLRSIGHERMIGAAPDGYLNRKLSDTLNTLRE